jgi:hypothetical protein
MDADRPDPGNIQEWEYDPSKYDYRTLGGRHVDPSDEGWGKVIIEVSRKGEYLGKVRHFWPENFNQIKAEG